MNVPAEMFVWVCYYSAAGPAHSGRDEVGKGGFVVFLFISVYVTFDESSSSS